MTLMYCAAAQRTLFEDQNSSGQHNLLPVQQPQPSISNNAVLRKGVASAVTGRGHSDGQRMHAAPVQQSRRLSRNVEHSAALGPDNNSSSSHAVAPLHTHFSLDSFLPSANSHQLNSFDQLDLARTQAAPDVRDSFLPDAEPGTVILSRDSHTAVLGRRPTQLQTSLIALQQQPQLIDADVEAVWYKAAYASESRHAQLPVEHDAAITVADVELRTNSIDALANNGRAAVKKSSQRHSKANLKPASGKGRADAASNTLDSAQPLPSRAAARALRQSGSFASPTRSSAAKARSKGSDGTVRDDDGGALKTKLSHQAVRPAADGAATTATAAPLMSTFRCACYLFQHLHVAAGCSEFCSLGL